MKARRLIVSVLQYTVNEPRVVLPDLKGPLQLDLIELASAHRAMVHPRGHIVVECSEVEWYTYPPVTFRDKRRRELMYDEMSRQGWAQAPDEHVTWNDKHHHDVRNSTLWVDSTSFFWQGRVRATGRLVETHPVALSVVFGDMAFTRGLRALRNE